MRRAPLQLGKDTSNGAAMALAFLQSARLQDTTRASMVAPHCDDNDSSISSYRSWLHTPPSSGDVAFHDPAQRLDMPLSPLRSTAVLEDADDLAPSPHMPLSIQVRKARILLFTSVVVATLLTLIVVFARGVPVKTIEGSWSDEAKRELVNDYNFYSGTAASMVAKPFELCVAMLLPVVYLVFATRLCLYDESMRWKIVLLTLQAGFMTLLTSAFSSLNVQLLPPSLSPVVIASDLLSTNPDTAGSADTAALFQDSASDPRQLRPAVETILRTAMEPTVVKSGANQCRGNGEWLDVSVAHSFSNTAWLRDMLPQGVPPTKSVQVNIGEVLRSRASSNGAQRVSLPFEMRMGANLLLHAMIISEAILPWIMISGGINSSYDKFLQDTTTMERADDPEGFLYAASTMLNASLHVQARALNYSVGEVTLNFTHFDISRDLVFDAVTIDIPYEAKAIKRTLEESGAGLFEVVDDEKKPASPQNSSSSTAKYDVATMTECGVTACLVKDSEARAQSTRRHPSQKSAAPQVQAFASCEYHSGSEDVTIDVLHGRSCQRRLNSSLLVYSLGKRIVADSMVLDPASENSGAQTGHFTNIQKYHTITFGRLAWKTHDVAVRFNAVCDVSEGNGCNGLSYQLDGNQSRYLVVGENHLPLSILGPFEGTRSQWTPLVMLSTSLTSDLLVQRNVKNNNVTWAIDGRCSDAVETLTRSTESNRWYMEYGLQEAYTSALFFLFQNAALRDAWQQVGDVETLAFAGSRVETRLQAKIPLQSALLSISMSIVSLLGVVAAVILGKRKEPSIQEGLDVHRVAKVLLVDQSFPKAFLQCTLHDTDTRIKQPLVYERAHWIPPPDNKARAFVGVGGRSGAYILLLLMDAAAQTQAQREGVGETAALDVDPFALLQSVEEKKSGAAEQAERVGAATTVGGGSSDADRSGSTDTRDAVETLERTNGEERRTDDCSKPVALKRVSIHEPGAATDDKVGGDAVQEEEESDEQRALRLELLRAKEMELFQNQLEKEMLKRRPDHFIIGVICRSLGGVPAHVRSSVWKELLGVARSERLYLDQSILQVEEDLENQKVISADAIRTRGNDPYFKQPETIELVTKILTYYCKCRNIRYKQGMNEVLAPFLILERDPPMPEGIVFQCFYALIDKFLPQVFVDREFKSLQCSFQLYRLLMLYHDPKLCHYLDQHDMTPELYVTPWFMTLFARNLQPELVFMLWDFFLLEEDPFLMHFVAYAMVAAHKDAIMSAEIAMLPQVLSSITLKTRAELEAVCETALALSKTTPRSFGRDLYSVCYGGYKESMLPYLRQLSSASSMQVYPDELVENLMQRISAKSPAYAKLVRPPVPRADDSMNPLLSPLARGASFSTEKNLSASSVFFIVLDCRPVEQYRQCHLSLSYHIDPEVVGSPDALSVLLKGFSRMKGCHFCFVGPAGPSPVESKPNNIAFDTISRLARNISGEKKLHVEVQLPLSATTASGGVDLPTSPGLPGAGANDIISREQAGTGARKLHYEHISVTRLVLMFLQKGFEHISRLDGGFDELKKEVMAMDTFTQEQLLVHAGPANPPTSSSSGGFKLFSKMGLTRLRSAQSDDGNSNNESEAGSTASTASSTPTQLEHSSLPPKPKPSATITSFSQRFQSFTSAAKDAVSQNSSSRSKSSPHLTSPVPVGTATDGFTDERLVGEEEWVEVCLRTREALEKSLAYKEVVFQQGSMGILLQKSNNNKVFQAVVDSIVPESQASESQQMERGDLLVSINGQSMANVAFLSVIDLVKDARRPVVLRFENPNKKKSLETFDAISLPPLAPTLVSATRHSIGIAWNKLPLPHIRYHLQYAKQSEFNFNPWVSVTMKHPDGSSSDLSATGITELTNGLMVGLDPGQSFVFRVRCGNGEKWGPYSLSSNPINTLEDSTDESSEDDGADGTNSAKERRPSSDHSNVEPVFIPGACPEIVERGLFYYRVTISLRARKNPAFDAEKLDIVLEKGAVVKCTERLVAPGTNQIFVRISSNDARARDDDKEAVEEDQHVSDAGSEEDDAGVWAFENTPEGAVVLERLPEYTEEDGSVEDEPLSVTPPTSFPLPEQAKSMVSSFFSGSGTKSTSSSHTVSTDASSGNNAPPPRTIVVHVAPKILQVFPVSSTSIAVTWDPINDIGITKYQIQYSKNRLAAMWWNANQEIDADTLKYTVSNLLPNTPYLFRIRGCSSDAGWGPYSEASESCRTLPAEENKPSLVPPDNAPGKSEASDEMLEEQAPGSRINSGNFRLPGGSIFSAPGSTPLRTGSTLLDKAVSVASRLTSRRRSLSSSTSATSSGASGMGAGTEDEQQEDELESDHMIEDGNGITYVNLGHWKRDTNGSFKDFRFYTAAQYKRSPQSEVASGEAAGAGASLDKVGERDVVVTPTSIFVLNAWASKREGYAVLEQSRMLESLVKITTQKSIQNLIVFHFKKERRVEGDESQEPSAVSQEVSDAGSEATSPSSDGDGEVMTMQSVDAQADATTPRKKTEKLFFVVQDADACVALVRQYYEQFISS